MHAQRYVHLHLLRFFGPPHALIRAVSGVRAVATRVIAGIRRVPLERWFWIVFAVLMAVYVFLLATQPTAAGRGGR
jgi:hypothetical protein